MDESDLDKALRLHFGKRAGSDLHKAVREYLDGGGEVSFGEVAARHGVKRSTVAMSVRSFREKMTAAAGSHA